MVMYQNDHPIHWTPAYVGGRVSEIRLTNKQTFTLQSTNLFLG